MISSRHGRGTSFDGFANYLTAPERETGEERVVWTAARNLPTDDPALAATFMSATAARSVLSRKPLYQVVLNFSADDPVDRAVMERVADRVLEGLDLADHQALLVAHRDRPHPHLHVMVNLVHPETGKAQSTWKDWRRTHQVLLEAERALGLRQTRPTRADEVARGLRTYERVVELTGEHYRAQLAASAASARREQLEFAAERARTILERLHRALATVYRNPLGAYDAYVAAVSAQGVSKATQLMFERPEQFGELARVGRGRAFGLLHVADEAPARAAVPVAAAAAREAVEATGAWRNAAQAVAKQVDEAFERELGKMYERPTAARAAFDQLASARGIEAAVAAMQQRPDVLGPIVPSVREKLDGFGEQTARTAARGVEAVQARAIAHGEIPAAHLDVTLALSRSQADGATGLERTIRAELHRLPELAECERHLRFAAGRLGRRELQFLEGVITAPQWAILARVRKKLRDMALGREEERERWP
jgi:hypothetical protein